MYTIVVSEMDVAGLNMKYRLLENFSFKESEKVFDKNPVFKFKEFELVTINSNQVFADFLNELETDFVIFASKHSSKAGVSSLTCHAPGNWGVALFGGKPATLCNTSAFLLRNYFFALIEKKEEHSLNEFKVDLEVTHHGPFFSKPCVFVELGSNETGWRNEEAALAVCETVLEKTSFKSDAVPVIGLGGTHYASEFSKLVLRQNFAFSHICPKYALQFFDQKMLEQVFEKSIERPNMVILDYKGLGSEKRRIVDLLKDNGVEFEKVRNLS